jgi:hypothetical protein
MDMRGFFNQEIAGSNDGRHYFFSLFSFFYIQMFFYTIINIFITLLENINKSRSSASSLSLNYSTALSFIVTTGARIVLASRKALLVKRWTKGPEGGGFDLRPLPQRAFSVSDCEFHIVRFRKTNKNAYTSLRPLTRNLNFNLD